MIAAPALIVVADEALPGPSIEQAVPQPMPAARHGFRYLPDLHFNDRAIRQHLFVVKRQARLHTAYHAIITGGARTANLARTPIRKAPARIHAAHCPKCEGNSLREGLEVFVLVGGRYWARTSDLCR